MATTSKHIIAEVENILGNHQEWMEKCQQMKQVRLGNTLATPDNVLVNCQSMACFDGNDGVRQPLPRDEIAAWCQAVDHCDQSWEQMRHHNPLICDMWQMQQKGFEDCRAGLQRLADEQEVNQISNSQLYQALTTYCSNSVFDSPNVLSHDFVDERSNLRRRVDQLLEPLGLQSAGQNAQVLHLEDREALNDALGRSDAITQRFREDEAFRKGFRGQLQELRSKMDHNSQKLAQAHRQLQSCITSAWNAYQKDLESISKDIHQQRRSQVKNQALQDLEQEVSGSKVTA